MREKDGETAGVTLRWVNLGYGELAKWITYYRWMHVNACMEWWTCGGIPLESSWEPPIMNDPSSTTLMTLGPVNAETAEWNPWLMADRATVSPAELARISSHIYFGDKHKQGLGGKRKCMRKNKIVISWRWMTERKTLHRSGSRIIPTECYLSDLRLCLWSACNGWQVNANTQNDKMIWQNLRASETEVTWAIAISYIML